MREFSIIGKTALEHRAKIAGVALLCVAFGGEALTLGRVRGGALVGQTLNMVVQVQMDAGEDASSMCFEADVFHADTRQDASRVRVLVEDTAQAHTANVRILSSSAIDEPVVTVYLRTGCGQKTTRRYVLLADMPSEIATPAVPAVPLVAPVAKLTPAPVTLTPAAAVSSSLPPEAFRSAPTEAAPVVKAKTARASKQTGRPEAANKRPEEKVNPAYPKNTAPEEKSKAARSSGQSRLKLDPLEFFSDRVANLESPAPVTSPEDTLRNLQRMQTLEQSLTTLLSAAAKNEATLADLKVRLQKAESARFPGAVIYALLALVLAGLAALAWLWNRQRGFIQAGPSDWWSDSITTPEPAPAEPEPVPVPGPRSEPLAARTEPDAAQASKKSNRVVVPALAQDAAPTSAVDVNLMEMSDSFFDNLVQPGTADSATIQQPAPALQARLASSLNSEAIRELRQQAEFFVSIGQTDQAVRILKRQIHDGAAPNPLVYLDLLGIFHSLNLKIDFQLFREDFQLLFRGNVPEFEVFKDEGRGLESYPDVLSRITALWQRPIRLDPIDACIFVDPRDGNLQSFDLAAFRDLLLLHAVAQGLVPAHHSPGDEARAGAAPGVEKSSFPEPSNRVPADDSWAEIELPSMLDLDLSDAEIAGFASPAVAAAAIDLPLLMAEDDGADGPAGDATRSDFSGSVIDFDLPEVLEPPTPSGPKPGPQSDRH